MVQEVRKEVAIGPDAELLAARQRRTNATGDSPVVASRSLTVRDNTTATGRPCTVSPPVKEPFNESRSTVNKSYT
jgi:hypothetical protein